MKKLLLLVMSLLMLFSAGVSAEENIFASAYKNGDWLYTSSGEILAFAGTGDTAVIPENSVVSSGFKFTESGILSEHEEIPIKKLVVSKNVKFNGSLSMARYKGFTDVEFYNTMDDMPKTRIILSDNTKLKTLKLPEGLTEIPAKMCSGCINLENVYLPDSVKTIGQNSFENCKNLKTINFPDNIETIGENAFRSCEQLKEIKLPSSLKQLGKGAFSKSGITKVSVPANVDYSCVPNEIAITDINFETEPKRTADFYHYFWNTQWLNEKVLPSIKDEFLICDGQLVKYLGNNNNVVIPDGVEIIGERAFSDNTKLKNVVIPSTVKQIGAYAFNCCSELTELTVEGSTFIGEGAFTYTALTENNIHLADGVRYQGVIENTEYPSDPLVFLYPWHVATAATQKPSETPDAKATDAPKATAEPTVTPMATSEPRKLEVTGGEEIEISVDEKAVVFPDAKPFIDENDRTQVPVRAVSEMLDCNVDWAQDTQTVTITNGKKVITIVIGEDLLMMNNEKVQMDTKAIIKDARTFIPVRFIAEALGLTVEFR